MRRILFCAAALSLAAVAPASAQMMGGMGMEGGPRSCVSGGAFVPCPGPGGMMPGMMPGGPMMGPGPGMDPGMGPGEPGMAPHRMTRSEMRRHHRMMHGQQGM